MVVIAIMVDLSQNRCSNVTTLPSARQSGRAGGGRVLISREVGVVIIQYGAFILEVAPIRIIGL
jgi:hypothetical protein